MIERLAVLYLSAFDHRRINKDTTPYVHSLSEKYPTAKINTLLEASMITTIWSGCYPHQHRMWQVSIKKERDFDIKNTLDYIPDIITTTFQCFIHSITGKFNLAAVPDWRRRRFDIRTTKYLWRDSKVPNDLSGLDSIFSILGGDNYNFVYEEGFSNMIRTLSKQFIKNKKLEIFEGHGMDVFTHWNIDDEEKMNGAYKKLDDLIRDIHTECKNRGITLMLFSDHGQNKVEDTIDISAIIKGLGIQNREISYFIESSKARFWFHTESAREKMLDYLSGNEKGTLLHFEEMYRYNIKFDDDSYGEYFFISNPGIVFHPNDFYHPLGNLYLILTNKDQRNRIKNPIIRGCHGHLPDNECEKGFVMLLDNEYKTDKEEIEIIDIAPTILNLLGYDKPDSLEGVSAFDQ